jgi:ubiquinone/menaquinone biosynthesis C-methylase UbiE
MKSDIEWKKWGEIDPLYGVATWNDKSKSGKNPWQDREFYALGKSDWCDFKRHWNQYGVTYGVCLEIGCGAGRITMHLADDFKKVKALDVSEGMIRYARERINKTNVEFILAESSHLPVPDDSVDAVFSTHVFQHFDCLKDASEYFGEIFRILGNDGSLMIHLPIYRWPGESRVFRFYHNFRKKVQDIKAGFSRFLIKRGKWRPLMRLLDYELDWLYRTLDELGFADVEFRIIRVKSNNGQHPFIFARKLIVGKK